MAYLQQCYLMIKHKCNAFNYATHCLSRPLVDALLTIIYTYGHQMQYWHQHYEEDPIVSKLRTYYPRDFAP
jgi:hypothetical protein